MYKGKNIIALCTSRVQDNYHTDFVDKLNRKLKEMNCVLMVYNIYSDLLWYSREYDWHNTASRSDISVFDLLRPDITDALIIMDDRIKSRLVVENILEKFKNSNAGIIVVDGKYENTIHVGFDYISGFRKVIEHIVDVHNARTFFVIAGKKDNPFSIERVDTFFDVLKSRNIDTESVRIGYGDFWSEPAREVAESIVKSGDIPDAVVCLNDIMAISASVTLQKYGIKVPDDVIVTGFDGYNEIYLSKPRITSCACGNESMIEGLAEAVSNIISGKPCESEYIIESKPIFLDSCGCKANCENPFNMYDFFNNLFYRFDDEERALIEVSAKIQNAESIDGASECWRKNNISNLTCLINKTFFSNKYEHIRKIESFDDTMIVFADHLFTDHTYEIKRDEILPDIEVLFDGPNPLVFMALEYADVPIGYVCYSFNPTGTLEFGRIPNLTSVLSNSVGVFRSMQNQLALTEQLELVYISDPLTGLLNRNGFMKYFSKMLESVKKSHGTITAVMCDLDNLKIINDKFGHSEGDNAIRTVGQAFKQCAPEDALCVRFGGDEIAAFIPHLLDYDSFLNNMHDYFSEYNKTSQKEYRVWASIGCYAAENEDEFSYEHLIKMADDRLYIDKEKNHRKHGCGKITLGS